ncbi:MAG: hypothetical protein WBH98_04095 [Bacteroidales bacterium]
MKKNSLIKIVAIAIIFVSSLGFFWACNKEDDGTANTENTENVTNIPDDEEIDDSTMKFIGTAFGKEICCSSSIGCLIELEIPLNVGKRFFYGQIERQNVVKAYNDIAVFKIPDEIMKYADYGSEIKVEGFFHLPEVQPSRACPAMYPMYDAPDVIIDTIFIGTGVPEETIINEVHVDYNTRNTLNGIFSADNEFLNQIQGDTLFYVINDEQALQALGIDVNLGIDFEKNCLICGRVYSPISSGLISSKYLVYNSQNSLYNYVVTMYLPNSGYNVITPIYFWGVYPKFDGEVIFTLKVVNES